MSKEESGPPSAPATSYRPSAFYWRRALRNAGDTDTLREIGMALVAELEAHKAFIRDLGHMPPKDHVHPDEMKEKGWG